jgi:putative ABC transport system permease protein
MPRIPGLRRFVRPGSGARAVDREVDDELRYHVDHRTDDLIAAGVPADEARRRALLEFGDVERIRRAVHAIATSREHAMRTTELLESIVQDIRYAVRGLRRSPVFALVAAASLALGIGATTAIFSLVSAVLIRPLPYPGADRLVFLGEGTDGAPPRSRAMTAYDNVLEWRARSHSFETIAIIDDWFPALTGIGEPERITAASVTPETFRVFRVAPALGRPLLFADAADGAPPVVVVSDGFWRRRLGADPAAVGRPVRLNDVAFTVVGVLPEGFDAPAELHADVWAPNGRDPRDGHTSRYQRAIARLADGVSLEQARADMRRVSQQLRHDSPKDFEKTTAVVMPVRDELAGDTRTPMLLVLGAAALVLLITCANLSNLLIARGIARARELAVRTALGASRARALRQLLTESALLAVIGTAGGLLLARLMMVLLLGLGPATLDRDDVRLDARVLAFGAGLAVLTTLVFGLIPALRTSRVDVQTVLKAGGRGSAGGARSRRALVVAQLALALGLLVAAGEVVKSFARVQAIDPGIRPDGVVTFTLNLPGARYPARTQPAFYETLRTRLTTIPGVTDAAVTSILPFGTNFDRIGFRATPPTGGAPLELDADRYIVSPGYFSTMGVRLLRGRAFTPADGYDAPLVAVIDELVARRIAPNGDPLGVRVKLPGRDSLATIVGVVGHVKHYGLDRASEGQAYMSHIQYPWRFMSVAVRTSREPGTVVPEVREAVRSLDPLLPISGIATMDQLMDDRGARRKFVMLLLAAFATLAATVASVGLYGVIAYMVTQRRLELGIRSALGAGPAQLLRGVLREGVTLAAVGVAAGLVLAAMGTRLIASLLFGVSPLDPWVIGGVTAFMLVVAVAASLFPARRAAATSPILSLRGE